MKKKPAKNIEKFRLRRGALGSMKQNGNNGVFIIPYQGNRLTVLISDGMGWDHVSVSLPFRTPVWEEMCFIKNTFFKKSETVIQYHPPEDGYINNHQYCLHMWHKRGEEIELPPNIMV